MTNPQPTADTNVMDMSAFVAKYGQDTALKELDEKPTEGKTNVAQPDTGKPVESEDDDSELDAATLEALGLTPKGETPISQGDDDDDDDEEGTEKPEYDLGLFAKSLGVTESDLTLEGGELKVRTKVDGVENLTPLSKLREGYQLREHFTRQNEEFLQQKKEWETARAQQEQQVQYQASVAQEVLNAEEQQLQKAYTKDWEKIRQEDPAEYAAQVAEYNQRLSGIRTRKEQLLQGLQQRQIEQQQAMQQAMQEQRQRGAAVLAQELGWKDQESFQKGAETLRGYLQKSVGLQAQEIDSIIDPRTLIVADKARKYDELMSKIDVARKKVSGAPRPMPTGTSAKPTGSKRKKAQVAMKRLHDTGTTEAAAAAFDAIGILSR